MSTFKLTVVDYVMLATLVVLIIGYSFGLISVHATSSVREWVTLLLVAFGFKKLPQTL